MSHPGPQQPFIFADFSIQATSNSALAGDSFSPSEYRNTPGSDVERLGSVDHLPRHTTTYYGPPHSPLAHPGLSSSPLAGPYSVHQHGSSSYVGDVDTCSADALPAFPVTPVSRLRASSQHQVQALQVPADSRTETTTSGIPGPRYPTSYVNFVDSLPPIQSGSNGSSQTPPVSLRRSHRLMHSASPPPSQSLPPAAPPDDVGRGRTRKRTRSDTDSESESPPRSHTTRTAKATTGPRKRQPKRRKATMPQDPAQPLSTIVGDAAVHDEEAMRLRIEEERKREHKREGSKRYRRRSRSIRRSLCEFLRVPENMKKHAVDELAVQRLRGLNEALLNEQTQRLELQAEVVGKDATISSLLLQLSEKDKQCQEHAVKMEQKDAIIAALYQAVNENEVETNALLESSM